MNETKTTNKSVRDQVWCIFACKARLFCVYEIFGQRSKGMSKKEGVLGAKENHALRGTWIGI